MGTIFQQISSIKNPKVKFILELQSKSKERKKNNLFILEGMKEIEMAIVEGYKFHSIFFYNNICTQESIQSLNHNLDNYQITEVDKHVFSKIAYRESTGGIIAIVQQNNHKLNNLKLSKNPLLLITEGIEKPGNLGALLRTADASNLEAIIICDSKADLYNPNVIRSSVGCLFSRQIAICKSEDAIEFLNKNNINIYPTALTASLPYYELDYTKPSAFVMGTEATGLTNKWIKASNQNIIIPMEGVNDSLNVSVSAAIVIFEAKRQRIS